MINMFEFSTQGRIIFVLEKVPSDQSLKQFNNITTFFCYFSELNIAKVLISLDHELTDIVNGSFEKYTTAKEVRKCCRICILYRQDDGED